MLKWIKSRIRGSEPRDPMDPYCPECGACGEDGCCSAMMCKQSPGGDYCQGYLEELRFGYLMYRDLMGLVEDRPELQEDLDRIWNENWERIKSTQ